jgi:hypothetical protein
LKRIQSSGSQDGLSHRTKHVIALRCGFLLLLVIETVALRYELTGYLAGPTSRWQHIAIIRSDQLVVRPHSSDLLLLVNIPLKTDLLARMSLEGYLTVNGTIDAIILNNTQIENCQYSCRHFIDNLLSYSNITSLRISFVPSYNATYYLNVENANSTTAKLVNVSDYP